MFGDCPQPDLPHIKFVRAEWATAGSKCAGVVLIFDTITNEYKAYWGGVYGEDEWTDICHLAKYGSKAPSSRINMWFGDLPDNPFE